MQSTRSASIDGLADVAFAGGIAGHRAVGQDEPRRAGGREVMDEVLDPGVVGVADRGHAVLPAGIVPKPVAAPIGHIEGRIGQDEVGLQVLVQVAVEAVGGFARRGWPRCGGWPGSSWPAARWWGWIPGRRWLTSARAAAVGLDELLGLDEHAARSAAGVEDAGILVRGQHVDQQPDHAAGRVELAALFAFGDWRTGRGSIRTRGPGCPWSGSRRRPGRWCRPGRSVRPAAACRAWAGRSPSVERP